MSLNYHNLDRETRGFMVEEINHDVTQNKLYMSSRLNPSGQAAWASLIKNAAEQHNDVWLEQEIRGQNLLNSSEQRRKKNSTTEFISVSVPVTAPETLSEGEFNRFYIRGLCRRVLAKGQGALRVYRAKHSDNPRPESQAKVGEIIDAQKTLNDLRTNIGFEPSLGIPPGPNSGLSVELN
jgi:hypothetical protein